MKDKTSIILSGNVYVSDSLATHHPEHKLPGIIQRGDIKIAAHLDERGRANLNKKTKKARLRSYSGFFTALLFDGHSWRTFQISDIVKSDARYTSQKYKHLQIGSVIWKLERACGLIAVADQGIYVLQPIATELTRCLSPPR